MSWGTCYKASNNIHPGFPAMMSEGNLYTDWNSACRLNNNLKSNAGIKSNYSYRQSGNITYFSDFHRYIWGILPYPLY